MKTYSLPEVAEMALPADWKRPVLWLQRRLRRGELGGYKVGHDWRMTASDVDAMIARYHTRVQQPLSETGSRPLSFTRTTSRKLRAS